jgi:hypothetical protein
MKLKHALLLAAGVFDLVAVVCVVWGGWQGGLTISQHVALAAPTMILFGIFDALVAGLAGLGALVYVPRRWGLGKVYKVLAGAMVACLLAVGLFPFSSGWSAAVHQSAAWAMIYISILLVLMVGLGAFRRAGRAVKVAGGGFLLLALVLALTRYFWHDFYVGNALYFEALFINAVFGFMLVLNYGQVKNSHMDSESSSE